MSDKAIVLSDASQNGQTRYLRFKQDARYDKRVDLSAQVTFAVRGMTPAFLRQVARDMAGYLGEIADELDARAPQERNGG